MTKIISIATLKGGISKTLSTYMIACNLADLKYKVLCMDFDPQSNLSSHFGIDISDINLKGVHNIFDDKITYKAEDIISKVPIEGLENLDIIPGNLLLHEIEFKLPFASNREHLFKNYLLDNADIFTKYDYILIDTSPSFNYLNQNAFVVSDSIIMPLNADTSAINGANLFMAIWNRMRKNLRIDDNVKGIFITMLDKQLNISKDLLNYINNNEDNMHIKHLLTETMIPKNVKLAESCILHKNINEYAPNSKGAIAYQELTKELIEKGIL